MIFAHPGWLVVGIVACLGALWTWRAYDARQRKALEAFVSPHLTLELTRSISVSRRRLKRGLFIAAVALVFAALAEPQAGFHWEQVKRRGNDIIFAVDTSRSMLTPDVKPNRLVRAKLAIDDFVGRLDGDAVGLVAFAGSAFLQCPLTLDYGAFHESLAALDTHIIPRGGTDISSAIRAAQSALHNRAGSDKVLILVTDGEDLEGDALDTAKAAFKQDGLKIYTVGVGSAKGDLIPLPADQGGGFLKDGEGRFVRSRLDEPALKALAQATGGAYAPLGAENQGLEAIYREALAPLVKHDLESRTEKVYIERYQWPLALCVVSLLSSLLIGTRRRTPSPSMAVSAPGAASAAGAVMVACVAIALLSFAAVGPAQASPATAASAYKGGDFSRAQRDYSEAAARDPSQPVLTFDAGTAAYKAGDFPVAAKDFQSSLDAAKSGSAQRLAEQQDAYYNLGNTLYREGQKMERSDAAKTIETWTGAVKAYDAALQLRADDADTKFNRELVNKKLEQLKKQQRSQSQQAQSQKQNQGGSKGQSQASSGNSSASQQPKSGSQSGQSPQSAQNRNPNNGQPSGADQGQPQQGQGQPQQGQGQPQQAQGRPQQAQGRPQQGDISAAGNAPQTAQNRGGTGNEQEQRVPGEMSPEEARELLDSVKDEERRAPTAPSAGNSEANARPEEPSKDW
jgi:Ca-activated chloride channel family protein